MLCNVLFVYQITDANQARFEVPHEHVQSLSDTPSGPLKYRLELIQKPFGLKVWRTTSPEKLLWVGNFLCFRFLFTHRSYVDSLWARCIANNVSLTKWRAITTPKRQKLEAWIEWGNPARSERSLKQCKQAFCKAAGFRLAVYMLLMEIALFPFVIVCRRLCVCVYCWKMTGRLWVSPNSEFELNLIILKSQWL